MRERACVRVRYGILLIGRCGYATLHDVLTKEKEDRMESFFLSEMCKYLYLVNNSNNNNNKNAFLFSYLIQIISLTSIHLIIYSRLKVT